MKLYSGIDLYLSNRLFGIADEKRQASILEESAKRSGVSNSRL